jgi:Family of unknown function (DUF5947)
MTSGSLNTLHKFTRKPPEGERCELCGQPLQSEHQHLLEVANRRLACSCNACAILFSGRLDGRYRTVPRRIKLLIDFQMTDQQWESLHLPINLAFFYYNTPAERVVAMFPSPAGATESLLTLEAWQDLEEENPILNGLEPDVEALLVYRIGEAHEYYVVPIDECFKLVGLIRKHWRGLSGGTQVWRELAQFFTGLKARGTHA